MCEVIVHRAKGGCCSHPLPCSEERSASLAQAGGVQEGTDCLCTPPGPLAFVRLQAGSRRETTGRDNLWKTLGLDHPLRLLKCRLPFMGEHPQKGRLQREGF